MFPELVHRRVEVLGGRSIQSQHDVAFHPATLLSWRRQRAVMTALHRSLETATIGQSRSAAQCAKAVPDVPYYHHSG
jgi:hypothetical protein